MFTGSSLSIAIAQLIAGIAIIRLLPPEDLGLWHTIKLALTYSFLFLAGVINGLSRELPYYLGSDNKERAHQLAGTALSHTIIGCLIVSICGVGALVAFASSGEKIISGILAVIFLIIFTFYNNYLTVTFRSKNSFGDLAQVQACEALLTIITIPFIYYYYYEGMVARAVAIAGIILFLLHRVRPIKVKPILNMAAFKMLLATGVPIFVLDYIRSTASTVDRLVLLNYGGIDAVGYYAIAIIAADTFSIIPSALANYIYPRMTYNYGKSNNPLALWRMAVRATIFVLIIMMPLAYIGWLVLPAIIQEYFPQYVAGSEAACIILFAAAIGGGGIAVNVLWSMKMWRWMTAYQVSLSVLLVLGPFIGVKYCGTPITGVAYGVLGARAVSLSIGLWMTYRVTHDETI